MKPRLIVALSLAGLWLAAAGGRLYQLQVLQHERWSGLAERQQQRVVEVEPPRGTIFDSRGRQLAVSVTVESAWAEPRRIEDPRAAAEAIAAVLGFDPRRRSRLAGELARRDVQFVWVERQLDPPVAQRLRALNLPGVHFLEESKRYYPNRELAARVLGFAGVDNQGLGGLEYQYDTEIAGTEGRREVLIDARRARLATPALPHRDPRPGRDLHLTLDATLQHIAEHHLAAAVEANRARGGSAVILDPWSGAVLAMASHPSRDANGEAAANQSNPVISEVYEPGSTFKMITAAAALEANLIHPDDEIDCGMGAITLSGIRIRDHKPFGRMTFREVIARSSNVGAVKVALRVGDERLHEMVRAFGFGRPTGIDLPGESPGMVRPLEEWRPLTKAYVSFGQGIAVTPLQLTAAFAAVANGGSLLRPYVVAEVGEGGEAPPAPVVVGRPISASTALQLERLLEEVVSEGGGKKAAVPGYRVAGKTGTAEKAENGRYVASRYVASFVGFAPARRPAVVCLVVIDEPRAGPYYGGLVAAPVFAEIVGRALLYLGIPPDRDPPELWPGQVAGRPFEIRKPGGEALPAPDEGGGPRPA